MMLEKFKKAQEAEITRLLDMQKQGGMPKPYSGTRVSFSSSLKRKKPIAIIAEYKRASPSKGAINLEAKPEETALAYARAGAAAISVLTEKTYFRGDIAYLSKMAKPGLPLLRKDFLLHPLQVEETAATQASALLLISRILDNDGFEEMLKASISAGLETVLEVFDEEDLDKTRQVLDKVSIIPQVIIQVNNRNLQTLEVSEAPSQKLIKHKRPGELWISASGIASRKDVMNRSDLGFDAVLVGSSLMDQADPGEALADLCCREEDNE